MKAIWERIIHAINETNKYFATVVGILFFIIVVFSGEFHWLTRVLFVVFAVTIFALS